VVGITYLMGALFSYLSSSSTIKSVMSFMSSSCIASFSSALSSYNDTKNRKMYLARNQLKPTVIIRGIKKTEITNRKKN
jgi:hypothetical protein